MVCPALIVPLCSSHSAGMVGVLDRLLLQTHKLSSIPYCSFLVVSNISSIIPNWCLFFGPTCEEAAVFLLDFLRRLKLLLGMFLWELLPQVQRVLLFSGDNTSQACSSGQIQRTETVPVTGEALIGLVLGSLINRWLKQKNLNYIHSIISLSPVRTVQLQGLFSLFSLLGEQK